MARRNPDDLLLHFRPSAKKTTRATVRDTILRLIKNRVLKPGDRVPAQAKIAGRIAKSGSTVIEAFAYLRKCGIITIAADGSYVLKGPYRLT